MDYKEAVRVLERLVDCKASVLDGDEIDAVYKAIQALQSCTGRGEVGQDW